MKNVFKLLEIDNNQKLLLCNKTNTLVGRMEQIIIFCPKTFTCNGMSSSTKSLINVTLDTEDAEVVDSKDIIARSIKKYTAEIGDIEKE